MSFPEFATRVFVVMAGMVYPGYKSFKAIKRADIVAQQEMLKYWLVLSVLSALLLVLEPIFYSRVQFFNVIKMGVVAFLVNSTTAGYKKVYQAILEPWLNKNEKAIDDYSDKLYKTGEHHARNLGPTVSKYMQQAMGSSQGTMNHGKSKST